MIQRKSEIFILQYRYDNTVPYCELCGGGGPFSDLHPSLTHQIFITHQTVTIIDLCETLETTAQKRI